MRFLLVKNWREHQHYAKRSPPWIKLHRAVIEDYAFSTLADKCKAHLLLIWVLAAGTEGRIPHDARFIASKISAKDAVDLDAMIAAGFLISDGAEEREAATGNDQPAEKSSEKNAEFRKQAAEVIAFLNEKAARNYDGNGANADHVVARLRDGETVDDMRAIIAKKCREWQGDEKMNLYLRPATLFNRKNYASYKGELGTPTS